MDEQHQISKRVQFVGDDGDITYTPRWTVGQVGRMLGKSPLLDIQLLRLMHDDRHEWKPVLRRRDCFHKEDLAMLLEILGCEGRDRRSEMEVQSFSTFCSAMWYLRVIPDRIRDLIPHCVTERNPLNNRSTYIARDTQPYPVVNMDPDEHLIWCWNQPSRESPETSYGLANVSYVLCWREVFMMEIKTVVWNWTRTAAATMAGPVECAGLGGPDENERTGLDSRRLYEMRRIRKWFQECIDNPTTPKQIKKHVQERLDLDPLTSNETIYAWMESIEKGCLGKRLSADHNGLRSRVATNTSGNSRNKSKRRGQNRGLLPKEKFRDLLDQAAGRVTEEESKYAREMLSRADVFIRGRQQKLADEMLSWRTAQVEDWERLVEGIELVNGFHEVNGGADVLMNGGNLGLIDELG